MVCVLRYSAGPEIFDKEAVHIGYGFGGIMYNKLLQVLNRLSFMVVFLFLQVPYAILNTTRNNIHNIGTVIDQLIPFNKLFIIPYVYWYAYTVGILVFFAIVDNKSYFRLLMSIVAGMCISFIIYYIFPTTVPRPEVVGNDILSKLVRDIYSHDKPFNCFPSIHILETFLVTAFLWKYSRNTILRVFMIISASAIYLSTLFVKQHYFLDVVSGTLLAALMFIAFTNDYLWNSIPVRKIVYIVVPSRLRNKYLNLD